jgi:uncharacterized surface anchored protein
MSSVRWAVYLLLLCAAVPASAKENHVATQAGSFQISGTLVDFVTGQPIGKARVAISPVNERDNFTTITTADDGRFVFPNLAPGKYTLTAQARGYLFQSFNQHDNYSSSIVVGPDQDTSNLVFRLPAESSISGVISDEAGEPVRDAQVMLYFTGLAAGSEGTRLRNRMITDDEGSYRFAHLPPGHYLLAVSAKPWYAQHPLPVPSPAADQSATRQGQVIVSVHSGPLGAGPSVQANPQLDVAYPVTFYPGVTEPTEAAPIVLGRGEKAVANLNLQPVPSLHVRINKEETEPGKSSHLALQRRVLDAAPIPVSAEMREVAPGVMEVVGIPSGRYIVRNYVAGERQSDWAGSRDLELTGNDEIDSRQGAQYVPVTATLQVRSGTLSKQAVLVLTSKKTREGFSERVNASGDLIFKQGVPPGAYEVSIYSANGMYLANISADGARVTGRTIEFGAGSRVKLAITVTRGQGEITGTALRDGKPLAGAMVVLVPADPAHNHVLFRRDQSDSDGTFTLPDVVPGKYQLLAIENGWELEWMNPEVLNKFMAGAAALEVQPNSKYNVKVNVH